MLSCLVRGLARGGHRPQVALDARLKLQAEQLSSAIVSPARAPVAIDFHWVEQSDGPEERNSSGSTQREAVWRQCAGTSDAAIVIAPEFDGILARTTRQLGGGGFRLLNCRDPFLTNAVDKLKTAEQLRAAGIQHPATISLAELCPAWLHENSESAERQQWVVKPIDGAGCEGLVILDRPLEYRTTLADAERFLVQPWIEGRAMSCSAIVDASGRWHWMPVMTQEFHEDDLPEADAEGEAENSDRPAAFRSSSRYYCASQLAPQPVQQLKPTGMLDRLEAALGSGALGWVGVDLVLNPRTRAWTVIEVNPRCTSSIAALVQSCGIAIIADLAELSAGLERKPAADSNTPSNGSLPPA